jgi:flavin reductase (DIM6/NTAB) family NADH-FMN oxidoreductase RutF
MLVPPHCGRTLVALHPTPPIDASGDDLRAIMRRFPAGVVVVTIDNGMERAGITIGSLVSLSLDPPLVGISIAKQSPTHDVARDAGTFAVNVLAADQPDVAWHFAGRPQEPEPRWAEGPTAPVLTGTAATISCRPWRCYDGGDHLIVIGEVVDLQVSDAEPLLFFGGRFRELAAPRTGIHWGGSMDCPDLGWFDATTFPVLHPSSSRAAS